VSVVPLRPGSKLLPERVRSVAFAEPPPTRRLGLLELKTNPRAHVADMLFAELSSGEDRTKPRLKS
jgi:hypothetical protein